MRLAVRLALALVRAAIPIVGLFVLGWPVAGVLFFFWFELVTAGLYAALVLLREGAARPGAGNIPLPVQAIVLLLGTQLPAFLLGALITPGRALAPKFALAWSLLQDPGLRTSALFQLAAALVGAWLWSHERERSAAVVDRVLRLQFDRLAAAMLLGLGVAALALVAAMASGADPMRIALLALACAFAVAWAASDLDPERFGRLVARVARSHRSAAVAGRDADR